MLACSFYVRPLTGTREHDMMGLACGHTNQKGLNVMKQNIIITIFMEGMMN